MTGKQMKEACYLAQRSGDHRLALLLAEASGSQVCQKLVGSQMEEWAELGVSHVTRAGIMIG